MASQQIPTGLGITCAPTSVQNGSKSLSSQESRRSMPLSQLQYDSSRRTMPHKMLPARPHSIDSASSFSDTLGLRSLKGMQGLLLAEQGHGAVELDVGRLGSGSGFKHGRRFVPNSTASAGSSFPRQHHGKGSLTHSDTLLCFSVSPTQNATELKTLLGGSSAKLKSGAAIPHPVNIVYEDKKSKKANAVSLEQAKSRARVEVDLVLESNVCVQEGYLRGQIKLRIRKRPKDADVLLAEGKLRIIGFECIPFEKDHHTFFQCASPLSDITDGSQGLFKSIPSRDGFALANEGTHVLPFAMHMSAEKSLGLSKGVFSTHSGAAVQYIVMFSIKVRDSVSGKRSIAHFYRHCEVWPHLDPAVVLAPASRPLQASTSKPLSILGGNNKVQLTAVLPRLTWVAGTRCYVRLNVTNATKKTVKTVSLMLVRTTTIFRSRPALDAGNGRSTDPDACQTTTTHKAVAESILEMGQSGARGYASAKGWWSGVVPGQALEFTHFVLLPPESLSLTRGRLLEVEYSIRVTLSAGSLAPDVFVTLPVRIINFMSIDPPPSYSLLSTSVATGSSGHQKKGVLRDTWNLSEQNTRPKVTARPTLLDTPSDTSPYSLQQAQSQTLLLAEKSPVLVRVERDLYVVNPDEPDVERDNGASHFPSMRSNLANAGLAGLNLEPDSTEVAEVDAILRSVCLDISEDLQDLSLPSHSEGYGTVGSIFVRGTSLTGPRAATRTRAKIPTMQEMGAQGDLTQPQNTTRTSFVQRVRERLATAATSYPCQESDSEISTRSRSLSLDEEVTPRLAYASDSTPRISTNDISMTETARTVAPRILPLPPTTNSYISAASVSPDNSSSSADSSQHTSPDCNMAAEEMSYSAPLLSSTSSVSSSLSRQLPRPPSMLFPLSSSECVPRPTTALLQTGTSTSSVKGRIAALEERVKVASNNGIAYV